MALSDAEKTQLFADIAVIKHVQTDMAESMKTVAGRVNDIAENGCAVGRENAHRIDELKMKPATVIQNGGTWSKKKVAGVIGGSTTGAVALSVTAIKLIDFLEKLLTAN